MDIFIYTYIYIYIVPRNAARCSTAKHGSLSSVLQNGYAVSVATGGVNRFPRDDVQGTLGGKNKFHEMHR